MRTLRVDTTAPAGRVRISGKRAAGQSLRFSVSARDKLSGIKYTVVDYGDRSPTTMLRKTAHRFRRGKFTVKLKIVDRAGNVVPRRDEAAHQEMSAPHRVLRVPGRELALGPDPC